MNLDKRIKTNFQTISSLEKKWLLLFLTSSICTMAHRGPSYLVFYCLLAIIAVNAGLRYSSGLSNSPSWRYFSTAVTALVVVISVVCGVFLIDAPAHALFDALKEHVAETLPGARTLISMLFNILDLMFVIYCVAAMVSVAMNISDGRSIVESMRTPASIVAVVAITNILIEFILGS